MAVSVTEWLATNPVRPGRQRRAFEARGAAIDFWRCREAEIMLSGPAGTGKTRVILEKLHALAGEVFPGCKILLCRKTARTMATSVLATYETHVLHPKDHVRFFGGSGNKPAAYRYPNGSLMILGGLDDVGKLMSTDYDIIYVNEAFEATEEDWERLGSRLRNFVMPYQMLIGDTNPQDPRHWIKLRADRGVIHMFSSVHEDNPVYYDQAPDGSFELTAEGTNYMARLDATTGVTYLRLRKGEWKAAEGAVYEFDRSANMVDHYDPATRTVYNGHTDAGEPVPFASIRRVLASLDKGFENPGVIQIWGVDTERRVFLLREVYRAHQTFDGFWIPAAKRLRAEYKFERILADPSAAGEIASLKAAGIPTQGAENSISLGIQQVQDRLAAHTIFLCRDALESADDYLIEQKLPLATEQEFDVYVWPKGVDGKPIKEEPVDEYNHGLDCTRYLCMFVKVAGGAMQFIRQTKDFQAFQAGIKEDGPPQRRRL